MAKKLEIKINVRFDPPESLDEIEASRMELYSDLLGKQLEKHLDDAYWKIVCELWERQNALPPPLPATR